MNGRDVEKEPRSRRDVGAAPTIAVIPAYRAANSIERVIRRALEQTDVVIVVDDACPESTGNTVERLFDTPRVVLVRHAVNRGVGGAVKTGISEALRRGAWCIVKIDADDQMDVRFIPQMLELLKRHSDAAMVKGNRFADSSTIGSMPVLRLIGNSALTFLVKVASGYWTIVDPTNGFIAIRSSAVRRLNFDRISDRYFFEIDLLCALGLRRVPIGEIQMPAIYGEERSSLSIVRVLADFPPKILKRTIRRVLLNYIVTEINVGTLYAGLGAPLLIVGTIFGAIEWFHSVSSGVPRTAGTIVLALLLFMVGFQLMLQALIYDVQFSPKTYKARIEEDGLAEETLVTVAVGSRV